MTTACPGRRRPHGKQPTRKKSGERPQQCLLESIHVILQAKAVPYFNRSRSRVYVVLLTFLPRPSPLNSSQAILSSTSKSSETNQNMTLQAFLLISCSSLLTAAVPTTGDANLMRRACFFEAADCTDGFSQVVSGPINRRQRFYDPNNASDPEICPSGPPIVTCWEQDGEEICYATGGS